MKSLLSGEEGLLGRGLGRSYGDAAVSAKSRIVKIQKLNRFIEFDSKTGVLTCEPGVSFADLINTFLPRGWFPPVTPGTKHVTMGGAFAADIHGKNHHVDGSFADFVESISLLDASGRQIHCSRSENSEMFFATAGGMGLTGIISRLKLRLRAAESPFVKVRKIRCANLQETFAAIEKYEKDYHYNVSWIDALAQGNSLGRGILILGTHAKHSELPSASANVPSPKWETSLPFDMPSGLLNRYSISAFNQFYYSIAASDGEEHLSHYESFFYPLDAISNWYRFYGSAGFIQYQCVLPLEFSKQGLEEILRLSTKSGRSSFLAVLKKFGSGHEFLSFPMPGFTLTLDMPVKPGLFEFTKRLDELVIKFGGRVYLAKDACLSAADFRLMYREQLEKWLRVKREIDPCNRFSSALAERLHLF